MGTELLCNEDDGKPPDIASNTLRKRFSSVEDSTLKFLVEKTPLRSWDNIAKHMPGRTARQCRDRYNNYLYKELVSSPWTSEEDVIIRQMYEKVGPKWVTISNALKGRSGNNVKNRWYKFLMKKDSNVEASSPGDSSSKIETSGIFDNWESNALNDLKFLQEDDFGFIL